MLVTCPIFLVLNGIKVQIKDSMVIYLIYIISRRLKHRIMIKLFPALILCISSLFSFAQMDKSQAIDDIFTDWDNGDVPGCSLGIIKEGKLIYAKGYGMANMEYDIPNSASSVFRIGSTSKQFTAACIVLLAEKGNLNYDESLKSIFPDFPDYAHKITIRHLMNHTSGIRDYIQLAVLKGFGEDDFYVDDDVMRWLINQSELNFKPGEEYLYSNSGFWLLGQIVNKKAGMNMADFAREVIFEPLGMDDTHFHNDHTRIVKNRASGYLPDTDGDYRISMTTLDMIGDGGIYTTINDIKKWDDAFYDLSVLDKRFWKEMTQQGILNNGNVTDYASGLMIGDYKGLKTIRHGGAFVGFRAELLRFPEERISIAILANRGDAEPWTKAEQIADLLLTDKLTEKVPEDGDRADATVSEKEFEQGDIDLNEYSGSYYSKELDVTYIFDVENGSLNARFKDKKSIMDCTMSEIDQFKMELGLVKFQRKDGMISGFELDSGRVKNLKFFKQL